MVNLAQWSSKINWGSGYTKVCVFGHYLFSLSLNGHFNQDHWGAPSEVFVSIPWPFFFSHRLELNLTTEWSMLCRACSLQSAGFCECALPEFDTEFCRLVDQRCTSPWDTERQDVSLDLQPRAGHRHSSLRSATGLFREITENCMTKKIHSIVNKNEWRKNSF